MDGSSSKYYKRQNDSQAMTSNESVLNRSLRCVSELPYTYQSIFTEFEVFNYIQSQLMDDLLLDDKSIVVSAPTGSGKTTLFELAIVRLLSTCKAEEDSDSQNSLLLNYKIVYMAPVKALCAEMYNDWERKFQHLGLKAIEVTGDSDEGNLLAIQHFNLVLTTPEKWDSITRKWRDHTSLISVIKLFLIDEVHLLNEDKRGSTLEAVVSRMKTVQESLSSSSQIRFIAVSATIPNIEDVAVWLGKKSNPAKFFKFGEETRPVKLRKVVKCFPFGQAMSYFKFDFNLSYKLRQIILEYSEGKPTLVFCSTRKSVVQTSGILLQNITFHFTQVQKLTLEEACRGLQDLKLRDTVKYGVGYHHAGLVASDRHIVEDLFRSGFLPVLICTSTLAMGVNLPAHLVVIKSTAQYSNGSWEEYSEGQLLQMMGRAGRPQFDSSATAIILTKSTMRDKYEKLLLGNQLVESNLHKNLAEHLNSEIVLGTITDIAVALHWLRSTFFYVRALRNPRHYGIPLGLSLPELEARLQAMCMRELNGLEKYELIKKTDFAYNVEPTENGKLMARLYIAYETMKIFMKIKGDENLPELIELLCSCHEFFDIKLRVNEKTNLNLLNTNKNQETIRFPLQGRIKTREMKVNCLLQAILGCLPINDPSLIQEANRIFRLAERVTKAVSLYLWQKSFYQSLASSLVLAKCLSARMWESSLYLSRHLPGIGPALASILVAARKVSFDVIADSNPRDLERILNKHPPFGSSLQDAARRIPQYSMSFSYGDYKRMVQLTIKLVNAELVQDIHRASSLLIGDSNNRLLRKEKIRDGTFIEHNGIYTLSIFVPEGTPWIIAHLISDTLVGVDVKKKIALSSMECVEIFSAPSVAGTCAMDSNNTNMTGNNKKKNDNRRHKDGKEQTILVPKKNTKSQPEQCQTISSQVNSSNIRSNKSMKNRKLQEMNYFQVQDKEFPDYETISKSTIQLSKLTTKCDKRNTDFSQPIDRNKQNHDFRAASLESDFTEEYSVPAKNSTFQTQEKSLMDVNNENLACSDRQYQSSETLTSKEQVIVKKTLIHNSLKHTEKEIQGTNIGNSLEISSQNQFINKNGSSINSENPKVSDKCIRNKPDLSKYIKVKECHYFPTKGESAVQIIDDNSITNEYRNKAVCRESLVLSPMSFLSNNQAYKNFTKTDNKKNQLVPLFLPLENITDHTSNIHHKLNEKNSDSYSAMNQLENTELTDNKIHISRKEDCLTNSSDQSATQATNRKDSDKYFNVGTEQKDDSNSSTDSKKVTFCDQISIVKCSLTSINKSEMTPSNTISTKCTKPEIKSTENINYEEPVKLSDLNYKIKKCENSEKPKCNIDKWRIEDSSNLNDSYDSWLEESDSSSLELEGIHLTKNGISKFSTKSFHPKENTNTFGVDDLFSDSPENKMQKQTSNKDEEPPQNIIQTMSHNLENNGHNNDLKRKPLNKTHNSHDSGNNPSFSNNTFINNQNNQSGVHINIPVTVCLSENKMYENHSTEEPSSGRSLLRNDYGDPFAPIHCPTTSEKSSKCRNSKPSFQNLPQNHSTNYEQSKYFQTELSQNPYVFDDNHSHNSSSYRLTQRTHDENSTRSYLNEKLLQQSCNSQNIKTVKHTVPNKSIKDYFSVHRSAQPNSDGNIQASGYLTNLPNSFHNQNTMSVKRTSQNNEQFQIFHHDDRIETYKRSMWGNNLFMPNVNKGTKKIKSETGRSPRLSNLAYNVPPGIEAFPNPSQATAFRPQSQPHSYCHQPQRQFFQYRNVYGGNHQMVQSQALMPQQAFFKIPQFLPESQVFRPIPICELNYDRPTHDEQMIEDEEGCDEYMDQEMLKYSSMTYGALGSFPSPAFSGEYFEEPLKYQGSPDSMEDEI